jgi:Zn-dependent protease with chaperone function
VARRDRLDRFLEALSGAGLQFAGIGWLLSLLVWSIRSLVDSLFRLVVLADRALSREMEFQADRVAVSLTGSDALIDALYRLQAADNAWDRTLEFANQQLGKGFGTPDLYEIHARVLRKLRVIFDDPHYGIPTRAPEGGAAAHRIFRRGKVHVSRMWSTHPPATRARRTPRRCTCPRRPARPRAGSCSTSRRRCASACARASCGTWTPSRPWPRARRRSMR